jgi:hypothetical protein
MDAHEYMCFSFQNLNILCSFWSIDFFVRFFSDFGLVHIFWVN